MALTKEQEEASIERALNQKWTVKLKQYDGTDFDSWREEVEGAFTQRKGKWLLEESRRGDGDLQVLGRSVLRLSIHTDLRFLMGKEGVKVHTAFENIVAWHKTQTTSQLPKIKRKLNSTKQQSNETGSRYAMRMLKLRAALLEAEGEMDDVELCGLIVHGLHTQTYQLTKQVHRNAPYKRLQLLMKEIRGIQCDFDDVEELGDEEYGAIEASHAQRRYGGGGSGGGAGGRPMGGVAASYGLHLPDGWFDGHCDGCGYVGHTRADCPDKPQRKKELRAPSWAKEDKRRSSSPYGKRRESGSASHATHVLTRDGEYWDPVDHEMHVRNAVGAAAQACHAYGTEVSSVLQKELAQELHRELCPIVGGEFR